MMKRFSLIAVPLALIAFATATRPVAQRAAAPPLHLTQAKAPSLLYLTHSAGFKHDVLPFSQQKLTEFGEKSGAFAVTATSECCDALAPDKLKTYDAIAFFTTGELPMSDEQKQAFLSFIRDGKAFIGIHSATDTFYKWPEYGALIGGYFDGHPWHEEIGLKVEDRRHPATRHFSDAKLRWKDEMYQFKDWSRDKVHVLLSLDVAATDMTKKGIKRTDGDFANAWTREYGKGRVFYTALGHRQDVWENPLFEQHLVGGIQWAMGKTK